MHRTTFEEWARTAVALLVLGATACGGGNEDTGNQPPPAEDRDFEGVEVTSQPLLATNCAISGSLMTVTVKDGESVFATLRTSDSKVTVNSVTGAGDPCEIASNGQMVVVSDVASATFTKGRSVILDYVNGLFMPGGTGPIGTTASTGAGIRIDLTGPTGDTGRLNYVKVRGSNGVDSIAVGATGGTGIYAMNTNAKFSGGPTGVTGAGNLPVALDALPDVTMKLVQNIVISAGGANDTLDASGATGAGVGTTLPVAIKLYGGDGNDTLVGGSAGDLISGGAGADIMNGCAGNDTYKMGASASGADVIAEACTSNEGTDTVDYSGRSGDLAINLSHATTVSALQAESSSGVLSGEASGDGAHINDRVVNIIGGAGDDTITIPSASTLVHKISGGAGDDSFTGGGASDVFDGQDGDDTCIGNLVTMDYSSRSGAVTVTTCGSGCTSADANDGDQSSTGYSKTGTGAATTAAGGIDIAAITGGSGFTAASVGNTITLSGSGCTHNAAAYTIVEYVSATSVKLDVSATSGWTTDTCDFSEALPGGGTNTGTGTTSVAKHTTGTVTGLSHLTSNAVYHSITLLHSSTSTGGGSGHTNDDGTYVIVKKLTSSSVAIDDTAVGTFAGSVTAMTWTETGSERDNVQCATVIGGGGNDVITGDSRNNTFRGRAGGDTLSGGDGDDVLVGEAGADTLYGGAGDDTLIGGTGSGTDGIDTLVGGDGTDILEGDSAADDFTCDGKNLASDSAVGSAPSDSDTMVDFVMSTDTGGSDCEF